MAPARLTPKARVAEKERLPRPLEMGGPTQMNHCQNSPAMRAPVVELPMDCSARRQYVTTSACGAHNECSAYAGYCCTSAADGATTHR